MRKSISEYCAAIGSDPLFVQGAGGNISWKDADTLWIKASGTWLSDAVKKDIFVPVILSHLQQAICADDFTTSPKLHQESSLRPSIETMLHALMPHRVVLHLHAVDILAHLVRREFNCHFALMVNSKIRWAKISYYKPGAELARAVHQTLSSSPDVCVVFLQNHGVVIGGSDVADVDAILKTLLEKLRTPPLYIAPAPIPDFDIIIREKYFYSPVQDAHVHQLAMDASLFERLTPDWALYPDHVVFLGAKAYIYDSIDCLMQILGRCDDLPEFVFVKGTGVFAQPGFSISKQQQLRCYFDVLVRQEEGIQLDSLKHKQIAELLNWDAEKYRIQSNL